LWDRDPQGAPRLWVSVDAGGVVTSAARWQAEGLVCIRLLLPDRTWLTLDRRAASHPLWGRCDGIQWRDETVACTPVQDWLKLREIPPVDRPVAIPPGGGAALLNFLARLMAAQESGPVRYRGPYPTAHLFDALCRSFSWDDASAAQGARPTSPSRTGASLTDQRSRLLSEFCERQWSSAQEAAPEVWSHPRLAWRVAPFIAFAPHPDLWAQWRRGLEALWIRGQVFEALGRGVAPAGGCRIWPEGEGWAAGLMLLGQPWRRLAVFDRGGVLQRYEPPATGTGEATRPVAEAWRAVLTDWAIVAAAPPLAPAVASLGRELKWSWAELPLGMSAPGSDPLALRVQAGVAPQFQRLAKNGGDPTTLALMAISDVVDGAQPLVRLRAQRRLAQGSPNPNPQALLDEGSALQAAARASLATTMPALVDLLVRGKAWDEALEVMR
jgi:hypothetical protein